MGTTALITGADGFIGNYLTQALRSRDWTVLEGVNRHVQNEFERFLNLHSRESLVQVLNETRPSMVIHLAAISFAAHDDRGQIYSTNLVGSLNLMLAIDECALKLDNFVAASSASVYLE